MIQLFVVAGDKIANIRTIAKLLLLNFVIFNFCFYVSFLIVTLLYLIRIQYKLKKLTQVICVS